MAGCAGRRANFAFPRDRDSLGRSLVYTRLSNGPSLVFCRRCGADSTDRISRKLESACKGRVVSSATRCRLGRMLRGLHPQSNRAPGVVLRIFDVDRLRL
eukprot:3832955-Pyramimonas_sp.AAC.1